MKYVMSYKGIDLSIDTEFVSAFMLNVLDKGKFNRVEALMIDTYIERNDVILELGSGVGYTSSKMAKLGKKVFTFDGNKDIVTLAKETHKLNGVDVYCDCALLSNDGRSDFVVSEDFWNSSIDATDVQKNQKHTKVKSISLDSFIEDNKIDTLFIDIEGAEIELFDTLNYQGIEKIFVEFHKNVYGVQGKERLKRQIKKGGFKLIKEYKNFFYFKKS